MSTALVDLQAQHDRAIAAADEIISAAERQKRSLSPVEDKLVRQHTKQASDTGDEIRRLKLKAMRENVPRLTQERAAGLGKEPMVPKTLSSGYQDAFYKHLAGVASPVITASLQEAIDSSGGYAAPITVDGVIVPLAPADFAVRRLATVIPTKSDRLIPQKSSYGSAALKTEASGTFGGSVPPLSQITLSAYTTGTLAQASLEILQDVPVFEEFVLDDISTDIQEQEEAWFISGSGTGEPQGLIGNVGAGVYEEPDTNGNLVSISGTLDLIGSLSATYYPNASWLMSRATAIGIRKAQVGTDLYEPVFRRENGVDLLHGFPIAYSAAMPAAARGAAPILFGDFAKAYIVGDRGGSAVRLRVLDQMWSQGTVALIGYRRTDGRVRRSEAIQQYNISAS